MFGLLLLLAPSVAAAQQYPTPVPAPRTTDAPTLRALAAGREIHERFRIGLENEAAGRWDAAAAEFERIIALKPQEPQLSTAYYDVALAYAHVRRLDDASKALRKALELDPQFLAAFANLIAVEIARNDLPAARAVADRFIAIAPDSARALYSRGLVALQEGDGATASADFSKLLRHNPAYAVAHYDLGLAEVKLTRLDDARREFETALDLAPAYARARFALATVLLKQGHRSEAKSMFAQVAQSSDDLSLRTLAAAMRDAIALNR